MLKKRLQKLEKLLNVTSANFCNCGENLPVIVIDSNSTVKAETFGNDCEKCRKKIKVEPIIIQGVKSQILAPI